MRTVVMMLVLFLGIGCVGPVRSPAAAPFYEELGGSAGIARLVDELVFRITNDVRIAHHFANTDLDRLREKLAEQICVEAGGPCTYTGDTMERVHRGMGITRSDFDALVEDLQISMDTLKIRQPAQNRLLRRLAPMHADIVDTAK